MSTILLAVGGNSLIRAGEKGTIAEQLANANRTASQIVGLLAAGYRVVLTHGNGPQVGAALLRSERGANEVPGLPLDVCDACTQGEIGYLLEQALETALQSAGLHLRMATILTRCVVAPGDPAFRHPQKPIGPFYSRTEADSRRQTFGWQMVEDALRGYRRVVPSPDPIRIVELEVIRELMEHDVIVIACGGGGIPVIAGEDRLEGVEAVIDKDRASALLAANLGVDLFVISTDADFVYLDYKRPTQRALRETCCQELEEHLAAGQFPPGNMGPKVESVLRFLRSGGREAIITSADHLTEAVVGDAGTHIYPNRETVKHHEPENLAIPIGRRGA